MDKNAFPSYGAVDQPDVVVVNPDFHAAEFDRLCNDIASNVYLIQSNSSNLSNALRQLQVSNSYTRNLSDTVIDIQHRTNMVVKSTLQDLQNVMQISRGGEKKHKLQAERLRNKFQETVRTYINLHTKVAEKIRTSALLPDRTGTFEPQDLEQNDGTHLLDAVVDQQQAQKQQQRELEMEHALMLEREQRVTQIESDIVDAQSIFRGLAAMVHEQGEVVDTIENNIENVTSDVQQGAEQLTLASRYQKKYRKRLCYLLLLLIIVVVIIVIIVFATN